MIIDSESLEVSTKIGCPVQCTKYCIQEVLTQRYVGDRSLTLGAFKRLLGSVPSRVDIIFAGVSEPFGNPEATDMIEYTYERGHQVYLFTTLVGLSVDDAKRVVKIPYKGVILHLPDACGVSNIPMTETYFQVLKLFLLNVKNIQFMNMGGLFVTDQHEYYFRGIAKKQKNGNVMCSRLAVPSFFMMPNGNVSVCCVMQGLTGIIGSLYDNTYSELVDRFDDMGKRLQDPESICHYCTIAEHKWWYNVKGPLIKLKEGLRR